MNELQVFENPEFGTLRTVIIENEPWFVGKDIASRLGYGSGKSSTNAVANHVDPEDKGVTELMTPGGMQKVTIINESGLYSLILSSKLPSAKRFKRWITSEVLPALRKTGRYEMQSTDYKPTRPITTDDYINAGKIIAKCDNRRLSLVIDMFRKAGLNIQKLEISGVNVQKKADNDFIELLNKYSLKELRERLPASKTAIYYYRIGKYSPRKKRREEIIRILEDKQDEESNCSVY